MGSPRTGNPMTAADATATASPTPPLRSGLRRLSMSQWIIISMAPGVVAGSLRPGPAARKGFPAALLQVLARILLRMIKSLIVPLLFATLVVGVPRHGDDMKRVGKLALRFI